MKDLTPFLQPKGAPVTQTIGTPAWKFGVNQSIQANNIRSSTGYFKNLVAGDLGTANLTGGTVSQSLIENGTVANNVIQGGTISLFFIQASTISGGTINSAVLGSPAITNGTINLATFGTPNLTGGTYSNFTLGGTITYPVNTSTAALASNDLFAFQTKAGSAVLVVRTGGTNFFFTSAGTF